MTLPRNLQTKRRLIGVVLLALLCAQWALLAHAIGHADRQAIAAGLGAAVAADHHGHDDTAWGHDAGTPTCELFDHLLVGQAAGGKPAPLVALLPPTVLPAAPAPSITPGPASRAYEARGPPRA